MKITKELTIQGNNIKDSFFTIKTTIQNEFGSNLNKPTVKTYTLQDYIEIEEVEFRKYIAYLHERALGIQDEPEITTLGNIPHPQFDDSVYHKKLELVKMYYKSPQLLTGEGRKEAEALIKSGVGKIFYDNRSKKRKGADEEL